MVLNYLRYVSALNCSLLANLSSLAAITECCIIGGWMQIVNGFLSPKDQVPLSLNSVHMTLQWKKKERRHWLSFVGPKLTSTLTWIWVWSNMYGCLLVCPFCGVKKTILCQQQQLFSHCLQHSTDPTIAGKVTAYNKRGQAPSRTIPFVSAGQLETLISHKK